MTELRKKLSLYGLTMIAIGSCIGSGIFITPNVVVRAVPHHGYVLLVWALGGIIALTGALTFAELGGMFPKAGGVYVFLKEAYGDLTGFLYGWVIMLVINTGALAALGIALAEYITYFYPLDYSGKILLAIGVIIGLTVINITGVHISQLFASVFTGLKLLAILGIIVVGYIYFDSTAIQLNFNLQKEPPSNLMSGLLLALIGVLWSFGGWHHATYVASETKDANRTVPRALIIGTIIVTITYLLVNVAYMLLLPLTEIAETSRVAGDAIDTLFSFGGKAVALAIAISIFGTIGIYTMTAPRIYFAMAKDGVFFKQLAYVHPRFRTPVYAMIIQALWATFLLLFWGTFENLITYVTFMDIVFMTLGGISIFIFRKRLPQMERPYRTLGYPIVPLIFIIISASFVVNTLILRPEQALAGISLMLIGVATFSFFREGKRRMENGKR